RAIKNLVFGLGIPLRSAFVMASFTASKASGMKPNLIAEGMAADILALDEELTPLALYVDGRLVHRC
ncbi:MAG: hypothetical protein AB7S45_02930, partial [Pseudothermotoga sp.]